MQRHMQPEKLNQSSRSDRNLNGLPFRMANVITAEPWSPRALDRKNRSVFQNNSAEARASASDRCWRLATPQRGETREPRLSRRKERSPEERRSGPRQKGRRPGLHSRHGKLDGLGTKPKPQGHIPCLRQVDRARTAPCQRLENAALLAVITVNCRWTMNGRKGGKNFQLTAEEHTSLCEKLEDMLLLGRLRVPLSLEEIA